MWKSSFATEANNSLVSTSLLFGIQGFLDTDLADCSIFSRSCSLGIFWVVVSLLHIRPGVSPGALFCLLIWVWFWARGYAAASLDWRSTRAFGLSPQSDRWLCSHKVPIFPSIIHQHTPQTLSIRAVKRPIMNTRTVVESINSPKPPDNNYQLMLRESVGHFLAEYKKGCSDFSGFGSIFFRLLQKTTDPPLEITWFYSAMNFHSSVKSTLEEDPLKKVIIAAKDLFQLLVSCSSPCNGLKKVAVLAPVMYELYYVASNCSNEGFCLKKEIGGLVEVIVSYISLCCSNYLEEWENGSENLSDGFEDLIRVWTVDRTEVNCEFDCNSTVFFPLVSGKNRSQVGVGCRVGYLAGVVMVEAFFLSLYLKFGWGVLREELLKDMRSWAVQTITGFQNSCFFDMLLKVLLEPSLPVTTLLSSEDEALLREVLYDVVILVDYSFLKSDIWTQLPGDYLKNFALTWLLVADNAVQFARKCCDQTRAVSYMDAFSKSCLPYQLIEWVTNHTGPEKNISRPNISTPKSLISELSYISTLPLLGL
ncbi:hypothetical protein U1Q18_018891 [Sarracenia purpurea var. burkii]